VRLLPQERRFLLPPRLRRGVLPAPLLGGLKRGGAGPVRLLLLPLVLGGYSLQGVEGFVCGGVLLMALMP